MRESIGGSKVYIIAIVLIFLFSGYLAFSINRSRVYGVKNEMINELERFNGNNEDARRIIRDYMNNVGYHSTGKCPDGTGYNSNGYKTNDNKALYCIEKVDIENEALDKAYFEVTVFFRLDIPIISSAFNFPVKGQTKSMFKPSY